MARADKPRLLIIGAGDIAIRALPWLLARFQVFVLLRNQTSAARWRALGARCLIGDLDQPQSLRRLAGIADTLLHFAPPAVVGRTDLRTRNLLAALSRRTIPRRIVYISTSGVYGNCHGEWVSESRWPQPENERAWRRLDAEQQLRALTLNSCVSILRAPGIYAADRLPAARLQKQLPVLNKAEDVYTNHIHADDLARITCLAIFRGKCGRVYNAVDSSALKMGEYMDLVAQQLGLNLPPRGSFSELNNALSPMQMSFMKESRRLCNTRLLSEFRLSLRHPTVSGTFKK